MKTNHLQVVDEVRRYLERNGRVSLRMLRRQFDLDDESLDELLEGLVDIQRVAGREDNVLAWSQSAPSVARAASYASPDRGPEVLSSIPLLRP